MDKLMQDRIIIQNINNFIDARIHAILQSREKGFEKLKIC